VTHGVSGAAAHRIGEAADRIGGAGPAAPASTAPGLVVIIARGREYTKGVVEEQALTSADTALPASRQRFLPTAHPAALAAVRGTAPSGDRMTDTTTPGSWRACACAIGTVHAVPAGHGRAASRRAGRGPGRSTPGRPTPAPHARSRDPRTIGGATGSPGAMARRRGRPERAAGSGAVRSHGLADAVAAYLAGTAGGVQPGAALPVSTGTGAGPRPGRGRAPRRSGSRHAPESKGSRYGAATGGDVPHRGRAGGGTLRAGRGPRGCRGRPGRRPRRAPCAEGRTTLWPRRPRRERARGQPWARFTSGPEPVEPRTTSSGR